MRLVFCLLCLGGTSVFAQVGPSSNNNTQGSNTLNVQNDCGARGNGSADDSSAIQSCINQAASGQTIYFPNGTYNLSGTLNIKGGVTYLGQSIGAVLHANTMGTVIFQFPGNGASNTTINSLTFDQGGIQTSPGGSTPQNVRITNCAFQNVTQPGGSWVQHNFIHVSNGLSHSQIDHNSFYMLLANGQSRLNNNVDYDGALPRSAIFVFGLDSTSIDHNKFDHVYQGIKVCQTQNYQAQDNYIGWNWMTHLHRMGMEIQDSVGCGHPTPSGVYMNSKNFVIEQNTMQSWDDFYWDSFGISFANAPSDSTIIRYNLITAPEYYGTYRGIGIEVGGRPAKVYNNTIKGPFGSAIAVFSGSAGSEVNGNYACGVNAKYTPTPQISDEMNPSPTDTYYHDNTTLNTCN